MKSSLPKGELRRLNIYLGFRCKTPPPSLSNGRIMCLISKCKTQEEDLRCLCVAALFLLNKDASGGNHRRLSGAHGNKIKGKELQKHLWLFIHKHIDNNKS